MVALAYPELQPLHRWLEVEFHPLQLHKQVSPSLEFIGNNEHVKEYMPALEDIVITRIVKQVIYFS